MPKSKQWIYFGVSEFPVDAVPPCIKEGAQTICDFAVEHDPVEHNYAHSEIRAYRGGKRVADKKEINREHRTYFRLAIMDRAVVIVEPLV